MKARATTSLGLLLALIISLLTVVPGARADEDATTGPELTPVPADAGFARRDALPVVDSQAGQGAALKAGVPMPVALPPATAHAAAALVRMTALAAPADTEINAAGTPALNVSRGTSASTTVLVPVAEGAFTVAATADVDVRIEELATFTGDEGIPGAVRALVNPENRPVDGEGDTVGVVGRGGVPATGVRAVFVTATVDCEEAGILTLDGQQLPVAAGRTSVTTVATPSADGDVGIAFDKTADIRVDVRGWVPDSAQDAQAANTVGGFIPTAADPRDIDATRDVAAELSVDGARDIGTALALVSAAPAADTALFDFAADHDGRGRGLVVDPQTGAQPQLLVAPAGSTAMARHADVEAEVLWLGGFLASDPRAAGAAPTIAITAPVEAATIDMASGDGFALEGTVSGDVSVQSISVAVDDQPIGTAAVTHDGATTRWRHKGSAAPGKHTATVTVTDRAGRTASASVTFTVVVPGPEAVVLAPETVVVSEPDAVAAEGSVTFAAEPQFKPGDIIVSDATAGAPQGFLRRVQAIDRVGDTWLVTTTDAALLDTLWQADYVETVDAMGAAAPAVEQDRAPAPGTTLIDEGADAVSILTGDAVGIGDMPETADEGGEEDLEDPDAAPEPDPEPDPASRTRVRRDLGTIAKAEPSARAEGDGDGDGEIFARSFKAKADVIWEGELTSDYSYSAEETLNAASERAKVEGGVHLHGEAEVGIKVQIVVKIHVDWAFVVPIPNVEDFRVAATASADALATLKANIGATWEGSYDNRMALIPLPPLAFQIGPVPFLVTSEIDLRIKGEASISTKATLDAKTEIHRSQTYGFSFSTAGGLRPISVSKTSYSPPDFGAGVDINVDVEAQMGPHLDLAVSLYDLAGPKVALTLQPGLEGHVHAKPWADPPFASAELEVFLRAAIKGSVHLKVPVIDVVVIEGDIGGAFDRRFTLGQWDWSTEDGVSKDDGTGGGGGEVPGRGPVLQTVSTHGDHALAIDIDGSVWGWGNNYLYQAAPTQGEQTLVPERFDGIPPVKEVGAGFNFSTLLTGDGDVYGWGRNDGGQTGLGEDVWPLTFPAKVPGLSGVTDLETNQSISFAVTDDGSLYRWGRFHDCSAVPNTAEAIWTPVKVGGLPQDIVSVTSTDRSFIALTRTGDLWAWGGDYAGNLGSGTTENQCTPFKIEGISDVNYVKLGSINAFAITSDGSLFGWGRGDSGQFQNGSLESKLTPFKMADMPVFTSVAPETDRPRAVTSTGQVYEWGFEYTHGTPSEWQPDRMDLRPADEAAGLDVVQMSHFLARFYLDRAGQVFSTGANTYGLLGWGYAGNWEQEVKEVQGLPPIRVPAG